VNGTLIIQFHLNFVYKWSVNLQQENALIKLLFSQLQTVNQKKVGKSGKSEHLFSVGY